MPTAGDPSRRVGARVWLLLGGLLFVGGPPASQAQTSIGPSKCVGCHDHERQATKWQKEEPAAFKGKAHFLTLKQLDGPKSAGFAKAIGLADPYDLKGSCVKCHASVFRGDANAGVSCESCHGAASNYNDLHQVKGSYPKAVAAGMRDLREKPAAIAKLCVDCHVTADKRLAAAGHPSGAGFDAGASLQKLVHWNTAYNFAQVTAAGRAAGAGRAAAGGPAPPSPAPAVAAKAPPARQGAPVAPAPDAPGSSAAATPAPVPAPRVAAAAPPTPATPAPPWDWDQPVRPLPADYVPEALPEEPAPPPQEAAPAPAPAAGPKPRPVRPRPAPVPPSIAEDSPLPQAPPASVPQAGPASAAVAPPAPRGLAQASPASAAAQVAGLRGEGVAALEKLLRAGARAPGLPAPARPSEFQGPDGELLRLQDEVLALALEALRRPKP